ncbi:hypothetical protein SPRG_07181 [Saprolegnia parasitica CBS 223.65]|uniref:Uncharacterized protein n=1 Tax=Saprolegnia parasitica (strain CBS 223.65) TaxID=695850 RepID=A0A067CBM5_SAPPC|nr:hypothetical protein SPRG_07181 [Saprolegnia parasitica CBS 223.65]KDO27908.1 hypothetical protein SPRG_07181 [Saprolegnia parasitica CBS 223.65]|eukprot:XP_012201365.1 hypothetical protein SPRG_07181 [Saprolegnia parasitica CBS 223.65]
MTPGSILYTRASVDGNIVQAAVRRDGVGTGERQGNKTLTQVPYDGLQLCGVDKYNQALGESLKLSATPLSQSCF